MSSQVVLRALFPDLVPKKRSEARGGKRYQVPIPLLFTGGRFPTLGGRVRTDEAGVSGNRTRRRKDLQDLYVVSQYQENGKF